MSNALAIATVMGTLNMRVQTLLNGAGLTGLAVTNGHPRPSPDSGVYLSLYQLVPHSGMRNMDLPTRGGGGDLRTRPVLPVSLRILLSFVGNEETLEAERLAGLVVSDLHARPALGPDEINAFLGTLADSHPLLPSNLAQQQERVKLSPLTLDSEELSRIWGLFGQNVFALSMAWEATTVLLDGSMPPAPGLPVTDVGLAVVPAPVPSLTAAYDAETRQPVVEPDDTLVVEGGGLLSAVAELVLGDARRALAPADLVDGRLRIDMTSIAGLRPGVQPLRVEHTIIVPGAADGGARPGPISNTLGLMVRPELGAMTAVAGADDTMAVTVPTTPVVQPEQRCELILDGPGGRHAESTFVRAGDDIVFTFTGLPADTYRVQLTVEGAANLPTRTADVYDGPTVVVP